jgi:hypothetical protein
MKVGEKIIKVLFNKQCAQNRQGNKISVPNDQFNLWGVSFKVIFKKLKKLKKCFIEKLEKISKS